MYAKKKNQYGRKHNAIGKSESMDKLKAENKAFVVSTFFTRCLHIEVEQFGCSCLGCIAYDRYIRFLARSLLPCVRVARALDSKYTPTNTSGPHIEYVSANTKENNKIKHKIKSLFEWRKQSNWISHRGG